MADVGIDSIFDIEVSATSMSKADDSFDPLNEVTVSCVYICVCHSNSILLYVYIFILV